MTDGGIDHQIDHETEDFAQQIADQVESFLVALREIARENDGARAISLLLLEISQVSLAGARLGAQRDFTPRAEYQPAVGPEADLDALRLRLAQMLGPVDPYAYVFDPYVPETVVGRLSDDLTSIATDLENGLRHYRRGDVDEALWWWQFSYVSSWGNLAGARLGAQNDFTPETEYQPDVGPDPDLDAMRERLARQLEPVDHYVMTFDAYSPELVEGVLSDDLAAIAAEVANGLRHHRAGNVAEALWWWQFSYVSSWGNAASGVLRALQSIVTHDRLDAEDVDEGDQLAAADEMLGGGAGPAR